MKLTPAQMTLLSAPFFYGPRPGSNFWSYIRLFHPVTKETIAEGVEIEPLLRHGYLRAVELETPWAKIAHPTEGFEVEADHRFVPTFEGREALFAALAQEEAASG